MNALETAAPSARALTNEYRDVARFEISQILDMKDYPYFAEKGLAAATTTAPLPADPHEWSLNTRDQPQLRVVQHRLAAKLALGVDSILPKTTTGAQVSYDCWVEQQEKGGQPYGIAACGDRFNHTMAKINASKALLRAVFSPSVANG